MNDASTPSTGNGPAATGRSVIVAADGGGDFTSIDMAVAAADAHTQIVVRPGIYRETVVLDRAVDIVGDGPVREIVLAGQSAAALWCMAPGAAVRGMTLRMEMASGRGLGGFLKRLLSSAATSRAGAPPADSAVAVTSGDVLIEGCVVDASFASAIVITGQGTNPAILRNKFAGGGGNGVSVQDGAACVIEENGFGAHSYPSIHVSGRGTTAVIRGNVLAGGGDQGIVFVDCAGGTVEDNELSEHEGEIGIAGAGTSPIVRRNRLHDGKQDGMLVSEGASPIIEGNEIARMARSAIVADGPGVAPTIRSNRIEGAGGPGILVRGGATGVVEGNEISDCLMSGIWVSNEGTSPDVRENVLRDNGGIAGIFVRDRATPTFSANTVSGQVPYVARDGVSDPGDGVGPSAGAAHGFSAPLALDRPAVTARVGAGRMPVAIAADDTDVWVSSADDQCISRIDPRMTRIVRNVEIPAPIDQASLAIGPIAIALDPASIWVGCLAVRDERHVSGLIARVDRGTESVAWTLPLAGTPTAVASGFGSIWVAEHETGVLVRVDPTTRTIVASIQVGKEPSSIASADGAIWVANDGDGNVVRIDPATNLVTQRIPLGRATRIIAAEGSLWVTSPNRNVDRWGTDENYLIRLDPSTGKVLARISGTAPGAVTGGPLGLWIALVGRIARVDTATNTIVESIEAGTVACAAATGARAVWVLYQHSMHYVSSEGMPGTLIRVDA